MSGTIKLSRCGLRAPTCEPVRRSYFERLRRYRDYQVRELYESGVRIKVLAQVFDLSDGKIKDILLSPPRCARCGKPLRTNVPLCSECERVLEEDDRSRTDGRQRPEARR
ncbi:MULTISPECIES: hypothetical protein [unclassified Methanopyrus]|uniref:hypothetical protein n=1 Tax=unclassified Methanopyrus TaxID=2684913 RepID=UPI0012F94B04|nr:MULTISPECIES: hypothetical protein [unclassified Methanopyrus]